MRPHLSPGPKCTLRSLENPTLNGILLGLELKDNELHMQPSFFPCCGGSGERFDEINRATLRCDLKHRYQAARNILVQYYRLWDGDVKSPPHLMDSENSARILHHIGQVIRGNGPQATMLKGQSDRPGDLWGMALAAAWRFGLPVHVVNFMKTKTHDMLPRPAYDQPGPLMIFVEQISQLWKPEDAMHLESVISFAYKSNSLLWLEFTGSSSLTSPSAETGIKSQSIFQQKIKALKSKSPLAYLEPTCLAELNTMRTIPRQIPSEKDVNL